MPHAFKVGDFVVFKRGASPGIPMGSCEVVRTLPASTDDQPRYHVKSSADGLVRSALEKDLEAAIGRVAP
jgi:hypothetical protein